MQRASVVGLCFALVALTGFFTAARADGRAFDRRINDGAQAMAKKLSEVA